MERVYRVANRKGGQDQIDAMSTLARPCDVIQAGRALAATGQQGSSRHPSPISGGARSNTFCAACWRFAGWQAGHAPNHGLVREALTACGLPVVLTSNRAGAAASWRFCH